MKIAILGSGATGSAFGAYLMLGGAEDITLIDLYKEHMAAVRDNGLLFKGYVPGAPSAVLSGGRYDSLLTKLGKSGGAIGFAVYLNLLERLYEPDGDGYAADVLLLPGGAAPSALAAAAKAVTDSGRSVLVQGAAGARCRRTARINAEGGLEYLD